MLACQAYAASISGSLSNCSDGWECSNVPPTTVCYTTGSGHSLVCPYCWGYTTGQDKGWVENCTCPWQSSQVGTWN